MVNMEMQESTLQVHFQYRLILKWLRVLSWWVRRNSVSKLFKFIEYLSCFHLLLILMKYLHIKLAYWNVLDRDTS